MTASSGFVYLVSANGITGARKTLQDESIVSIRRTASLIRGRAPLAVGFGLSLSSHVRQVIDNGASAAIVGSRFAQIVEQNLDDGQAMLKEIRECAQTLKDSTFARRKGRPQRIKARHARNGNLSELRQEEKDSLFLV